MTIRIQYRRGTAALWTAANPILSSGEVGFETDTHLMKLGDGATAWNALEYVRGDLTPESQAILDAAVSATAASESAAADSETAAASSAASAETSATSAAASAASAGDDAATSAAAIAAFSSTGYLYRGQFQDADVASFSEPGTYYLYGTPTGLPSDWNTGGPALLVVQKFSTNIIRTVTPRDRNNLIWRKKNSGSWEKILISGLPTAIDFARNYAYRTVVSTGSIDALIDEGRYIVTTAVTGRPSGSPSETSYLAVEVYGTRVWQVLRYETSARMFARKAVVSGGIGTWVAWSEIGVITTASATTLGGVKVGANLAIDASGVLSAPGGNAPLAGKVIAFIGDSITERGGFPDLAAARVGATALQFGFGGCRMGKHTTGFYDGMCGYRIAAAINSGDFSGVTAAAASQFADNGDDNRTQAAALAAQDWADVDVVIVGFGTNDWGATPMGAAGDNTSDGSSFIGSINYIIEQITSAYPHIAVGFITPTYRRTDTGDSNDTASGGLYVADFCDAIIATANASGLPVLDMYRSGGFNAHNWSLLQSDGVHPTDPDGIAQYGGRVGAWLSASF